MEKKDKTQSKLKTVIMACFLLMSFALAQAQQPYKFKIEEESDFYLCTTKSDSGYGVNEKSFCGDFSLGCKKGHHIALTWGLFPKDKDDGINLFFLEEDGITIKFQLSNGEEFETKDPVRAGKLYWFGSSSTSFKSSKSIKQNSSETGSYFIGQLRKYNITKISISDKKNHRVEFNTGGFRSAITIDAMSKALMAKTGDQGQYGSISNEGLSSNSSQPKTTTPRVYSVCPDDNHPHAIDLGLPSGTKWYCCNMGASKPEHYGDYNFWSRVSGQAKIPSIYDFKELINHCSYKFKIYNGVYGGMFTSSNGNSVFFPATGYRKDNRVDSQGEYGNYWSDSFIPGNTYNVYNLSFNKDRVVYDDFTSRDYQLSIRLVIK